MELAYSRFAYLGGGGIFQAGWRGGKAFLKVDGGGSKPYFQGNLLHIRENESDTLPM